MRFCKFVVAIFMSLFLMNTGAFAMKKSQDAGRLLQNVNPVDVCGTLRLGLILKQNIGRVKFVKCESITFRDGQMISYKEGNFNVDEEHLIAWCARCLWDNMKICPNKLSEYLKRGVIVFYCTERSKTLEDDGGCCVFFEDNFD